MLQSVAPGIEPLLIEVELNREHKVVTLHMLEFDAELVTRFVAESLPHELGVRIDDSLFEHLLDRALYSLVIAIAGRHHPASLHHLSEGRVSIRLGDPDSEYLARCLSAIKQLLESLREHDIEAIVTGIDRYGRPEPNNGFLHLYVIGHQALLAPLVRDLCIQVEKRHGLGICVLSSQTNPQDTDRIMSLEPYFSWDATQRQAVRKNWTPA